MKAVMVKLVPGVLILLVLLAAALISCGKGKGSLAPTGARTATQDSAAQDTGVRKAKSLEDALAELNALEKPLQADPDAWLAMKAKLAKLLTAKLGEGKSAMKYVPCFDQLNAAKTSASKDYVKPRGLHWEKDSDPYSPSAYGKLVWTYVNDGDYDQDGIVGVADITPLA